MNLNKKQLDVNITTLTMVKIVMFIFLIYFLFLIKDIIAILFVSLILSSAFDPWVDWLQRKKIPRGWGIAIIYLSVFLIIGLIIYAIVPIMINQFSELYNNLPNIFNKFNGFWFNFKGLAIKYNMLENIKQLVGGLSSNLQVAAGGIFNTISSAFGSIATFIMVLVITFYMVVEENAIKKLIWSISPKKYQKRAIHLINETQKKIGLWLRGQLVLCFAVFLMTYIGLILLGFGLDLFGIHIITMKYALVLALFAGLTEAVPYLGPTLGAVPAVFLALTQDPVLAIYVTGLYVLIQQAENNILVPKIMEKAVGINPIVSIAVLMIGFNIGGIMGAVLAIPVATAIGVFFKELFDSKKSKNEFEEEII